MASVNKLSADHQAQIVKFIRFFRSKREVALNQIQADFDDTKNDSLTEDMYTIDEVKKGYDSICHVVKDTCRNEVGSIINMSVLVLSQLFDQADDEQITLEMDTSLVEDQRLLEEVEKMRLDKSDAEGKKGMRLKDTLVQTKKDLAQAESDRDLAQGKLKSMTKKYKKASDENDELKAKIAELEARLNSSSSSPSLAAEGKDDDGESKSSSSGGAAGPGVRRSSDSLHSAAAVHGGVAVVGMLRGTYEGEEFVDDDDEGKANELEDLPARELADKYRAARNLVRELKNELNLKLADSKQFQQLRKMMRDKNEQLTDLKGRLRKHEPDGCDETDM